MPEPYANIHHFGPNNNSDLRDDDGDEMLGWYFQLMSGEESEAGGKVELTELIGPYGCKETASDAALAEWSEITA